MKQGQRLIEVFGDIMKFSKNVNGSKGNLDVKLLITWA
jgi:hypothetical protein